MGLDLHICVIDGDQDAFEQYKKDKETLWFDDDLYKTKVSLFSLGYYKPFANGFLIDHYDEGLLGPVDQVLTKFEEQKVDAANLVDKEYVTDEAEMQSVQEHFDDLITALKNVDVKYTNRQIIMVSF